MASSCRSPPCSPLRAQMPGVVAQAAKPATEADDVEAERMAVVFGAVDDDTWRVHLRKRAAPRAEIGSSLELDARR